MTALDLETEYNNRARVPDHPGIIAGWQADAAAYRETALCELGISYGEGERQLYDLRNDPDELHNIVTTGDPKLVQGLAKQLAALRTCGAAGCRRADHG